MNVHEPTGRLRLVLLGVMAWSLVGGLLALPAGAGDPAPVESATVNRQVSGRIPPDAWSDDFQTARLHRGAPLWFAINTTGGSRQRCEPRIAGVRGGRSMWLRWVAGTNRNVIMHTNGSEFDTLLGVYTGTNLCNLTEVASDNDSGAGNASMVRFRARAGQTYRVVIDGRLGRQGYGNFRLRLP